jgi:lipid II:glycine glycyltransferase (peptidoglycan interpeptide bridge formation enzyme)
MITSMGIYGYLSAAYQETANKEGITQKELAIFDSRIDNYKQQKSSREETATSVQERITQLNEGINNIEYSWVDRDGAGDQRLLLSTQLEIANDEYLRISNDISNLDSTILALENERFETEISSDVAAELGPLKYISKISGWDMDKTVNILILIIVFVFDPLAICLVLAANFAFSQAFPKKRENIYGEKVVITQTPIVELEADPNDLPDLGEKKTNSIDVEIKKIDNAIKKTKKITKSSLHRKQKLESLEKRKQNLINKKKDDDLTITY